jgi:hypothetical protein
MQPPDRPQHRENVHRSITGEGVGKEVKEKEIAPPLKLRLEMLMKTQSKKS